MKGKKFFLRDPKDLNLRFYERYDEEFLLRKAKVIMSVVDNFDAVAKSLIDNEDETEQEKRKYIETLNAELHFSEFQQFEAFFALLIAIFQELPHWLYLTTYSTREIKQKVASFLEGDISSLTNGLVDNKSEFVNEAVYAQFRSDKEEVSQNWQTNIDNIIWVIERIANKYMSGTEFNAYKHGLRTMTGPTYVRIFPTGEPEKGIKFESDDSLRFLELEELEKNVFEVKETFKHFNPLESISHIYFMSALLETIKSVRLARLRGETKTRLNSFVQLNKESLNKLVVATKWSYTL